MQAEPDDGDEGDADLDKLEPPRHHGLVEAVGELAAEGGEKEVRRDENRGGERDERLGVGAADMEQDQEDQCVLEEIVAERREKLGPEQGREAPRHQQRRGHGSPAGSKWAARPRTRANASSVSLPSPASGQAAPAR